MPDCAHALPRGVGNAFYFLAIVLLLGAVAAAFIQKQRESKVGTASAAGVTADANVSAVHREAAQRSIRVAKHWQLASVVVASLAVFSWGIATWRGGNRHWTWMAILLAFYVLLEVMMV